MARKNSSIRNGMGMFHAFFIVLVVVSILFMLYFLMMKPFAMIFDKFTDDGISGYTTKETCEAHSGIWDSGKCAPVDQRAVGVMNQTRKMWLLAPFILVLGLIIWLYTVATQKDPMQFDIGGPRL